MPLTDADLLRLARLAERSPHKDVRARARRMLADLLGAEYPRTMARLHPQIFADCAANHNPPHRRWPYRPRRTRAQV